MNSLFLRFLSSVQITGHQREQISPSLYEREITTTLTSIAVVEEVDVLVGITSQCLFLCEGLMNNHRAPPLGC